MGWTPGRVRAASLRTKHAQPDRGGFAIRARSHSTVFRRGSNVLDYWLVHGEGFRVATHLGGRRRVNHVIVDPGRGRATALVVRSSIGGKQRTLPADAIAGVDPFHRVLYVEQARTAAAKRAVSTGTSVAASSLANGASATGAALRKRAPTWRRHAIRAGARTATALEHAGGRLERGLVAAVRWLGPRLHAAAVHVAIVVDAAARRLRPRLAAAAARLRGLASLS